MKSFFSNILAFTIVFFIILVTDVLVKLYLIQFPYRYISKPLVILMLIGFYVFNEKEDNRKKFKYVVIGLCCFLLGDIFLINHLNTMSLVLGMFLFMFGKVCYTIKFSHKGDFELKRLVPFLLVVFAYMSILFYFIYDNLDNFFVPVLFYFFVSLLMGQMVFLRKDAVRFKSYMIVLIAVELFVIGETAMALKMFYGDIPFQDVLTMLLYGISQYLIIIGILREKSQKLISEN